MPKITIKDETYFKLLELKAKLKAKTWEELVDKIYEMVIKKQKIFLEENSS